MILFNVVVAIDKNNGIGKGGMLPWHLPGDLKYFKELTTASSPNKKNVVVMGRKTWESIPENFRPLPGRMNLVITRNKEYSLPKGVLKADSFDSALDLLDTKDYCNEIDKIFMIGGQQVFETALQHTDCNKIYVTHIENEFECDTFLPKIPSKFNQAYISEPVVENDVRYSFAQYQRS